MKNISDIVDRLKNAYKLQSDSRVAQLIGMSKTALYNHKLRGSIPFDVLSTFCDRHDISFDWLLTGEGEMYRRKGGAGGNSGPIDIKDIPLYNIKEWLEEFWANAGEDEKAWLKVEFGRAFPEYREWLLKKERADAGEPPASKSSAA